MTKENTFSTMHVQKKVTLSPIPPQNYYKTFQTIIQITHYVLKYVKLTRLEALKQGHFNLYIITQVETMRRK
jgi:hypothetical protein